MDWTFFLVSLKMPFYFFLFSPLFATARSGRHRCSRHPMDERTNDDNVVCDDDDTLYEVEPPRSSPSPSYLDLLPRELVSLVAVHVARSDTSALDGLASIATHARRSIAAARVPLPWLPQHSSATLERLSHLAKALGARGIDDIADRARRCVVLAYIDWVAASAPADVPDAVMAASALVATAESIADLGHLCRLVVGSAETCRRTPKGCLAISGLGARLPPSQRVCSGRNICELELSVVSRIIDAPHMAERDGVLDGCSLRRWMDDAIDAAAKKRCPGAFAVAPEVMPRFSDLFAVDGACVVVAGAYDAGFCLAGQLRPLW